MSTGLPPLHLSGVVLPEGEHPGSPLGEGLLPQPVEVRDVDAAHPDTDVAVRVDQPGQQPAAGADRLHAGHRIEGEPAVADPDVTLLPLGQHDTGEVDVRPRRRGGH